MATNYWQFGAISEPNQRVHEGLQESSDKEKGSYFRQQFGEFNIKSAVMVQKNHGWLRHINDNPFAVTSSFSSSTAVIPATCIITVKENYNNRIVPIPSF
ncbi:hypothetical protein GQ457_03G033980 [Hibiscus cannabinus]